eukprot:SAG11_NODE_2246_length_3639_cov_1.957062_3_plen_32_part_00
MELLADNNLLLMITQLQKQMVEGLTKYRVVI